jgi:hypothetical protein
MRYLPFALWGAITIVLILIGLSDLIFGKSGLRLFGIRLLLAVIWPLAILSAAGRNILFRAVGKEL